MLLKKNNKKLFCGMVIVIFAFVGPILFMLKNKDVISISRIETKKIVPYSIQRVFDPQLKKGKQVLIQEGEEGIVLKEYLVRYEKGKETERREINSTVQKEMIPEITAYGTKGTITVTSRNLVNPQKTMNLQATAYTHTGNPTYTGVYPQIGTVAVDPKVIPLGSRMWIEHYGYGIAQDTGGLIKGNIIDLFMDTEEECWHWGRRNVKVYILE